MSKSELIEQETIHPLPAQQDQCMSLIQLAVEKGTDITHLETLMDLQERYEANQAKKDFNAAMSKFQSLLPVIEKTGVVDYTNAKQKRTYYKHAKLEDIAKAIKPALKETGISYRFTQKQEQGWITVVCIVTHASGHSEISELTSQPDVSGGKDPLKALASAISYLRRYTLTGSLGIVVGGEDDDGGENNETNGNDNQKKQLTCSEEYFKSSLPKWEKAILSNKKTPEEIIGLGNDQGIFFTDKQLSTIRKVGSE